MPTRFLLVSGKTLEDLLDTLNTEYESVGRVVFMEKTRTGYSCVIDTYALVVATLEDVMGAEAMEAERREFNRRNLENAELTTINSV